MKKSLTLLFVMMAVLCVYSGAFAASGDFGIKAEILAPIQLVTVGDTLLDFGRVFKGSAETVVDPANPAPGTTAAEFQVVGEDGYEFEVTLPTTATISYNGNELTVDNFTTNLTNNIGALTGGNANFKVGGTLQAIPVDAVSGVYTGSATVTVEYKF